MSNRVRILFAGMLNVLMRCLACLKTAAQQTDKHHFRVTC